MPGCIDQSLERLVELAGDPQKEIYSLMYSRYPDLEALFVLDKDNSVRGAMLTRLLNSCLLTVTRV